MWWMIFAAVLCVCLSVRVYLGRLRIHGYQNVFMLVTGCDTGFGNLLAKRLDRIGIHVIAGCLTEAGVTELGTVCSDNLLAIKLDITKVTDIENAVSKVKERLPPNQGLWALVNNARVLGPGGMLDYIQTEDCLRVMQVNVFGHIEMVRHFLPFLRMSSGRIVMMASVGGRFGGSLFLPYHISKYAIEGYCDTIRVQLLSSNVSVHILEPGFHNTPIERKSEWQKPDTVLKRELQKTFSQAGGDVKAFYGEDFIHKITSNDFIKELWMSSPEGVIDAYIHAITARYPKYRYVVGWDAKLITWILLRLPEYACDFVLGHMYPAPAPTHGMFSRPAASRTSDI